MFRSGNDDRTRLSDSRPPAEPLTAGQPTERLLPALAEDPAQLHLRPLTRLSTLYSIASCTSKHEPAVRTPALTDGTLIDVRSAARRDAPAPGA